MRAMMAAFVDKTRSVAGISVPSSLREIGYLSVGMDDGYQLCTALSGSISTVLTGLSWICVGIHSRRALTSPVCA